MNRYIFRTIAAAAFALTVQAGWAQSEWEADGVVGYGFYKNGSVISTAGTATAGIHNRFAAGAGFTQDMYDHISGEIQYLYQDGDPFISSGSALGIIQGQSHTLDYAVQFHPTPRTTKLRPYFLAGGGGKDYRVTGPPPNPQPLPKIVTLTNQSNWELMALVGVGVKYRLTQNLAIGGEFRDYITPFPGDVFHAATGATKSGIFHQFTPVFHLGYYFGGK